MTVAAVADTHAVVWHFSGDPRLSAVAASFIDTERQRGNEIAFSSITLAEILYLSEKGRLAANTFAELTAFLERARASFVEAPFTMTVARAMVRVSRADVPDLPDRIIAATALHLGVPPISRDRKIRTSGIATIW